MSSCNILVTGGQGFLGKTLQRSVHKNSIDKRFTFLSKKDVDLFNQDEVNSFFNDMNFDCVINLASSRISGISGEMNTYQTFLENNLINNNVFNSSLNTGIKNFINIGSSSIYPPSQDKITENNLFTGDPDPGNFYYSLSKLIFTRFLIEVDRRSDLHYKSLIVPNLFGPGGERSPERSHLINAILSKMHSFSKTPTKHIEIWGDGKARREFLYAQNLTDYLTDYAIDNIDVLPSIMNLGEDEDFEIIEYYNIVAKILSLEPRYEYLLDKPVGAKKKLMDSSLAKKFKWSPRINTIKGIEKLNEYEKNLY